MADTMLALPSAAGSEWMATRRRLTIVLVSLVAGVATFLVHAGLVTAYLAIKAAADEWPPKGVTFDNYTANTLVITVLLASVAIEWAAHAIKHDFRGHALFAFGVTLLFAVAFLNGLGYLITRFPFEPAEHAYATVAHAMTVTAWVSVFVGAGFVLLTFLRAIGHQLTAANHQLVRACASYWHLAAAGWIAVYYALYVTK